MNEHLKRCMYLFHDIKNSLGGSLQLLEEIAEEFESRKNSPDTADSIKLIFRHLKIINETLDDTLSSMSGKYTTIEPETVDTSSLLNQVNTILYLQKRADFISPSSMPLIKTRKARLYSILLNLLDNAAKHSRKGDGCIVLDWRGDEDGYEFTIRNTWGRSRSPAGGPSSSGYGIGLAAVQQAIEDISGWTKFLPGDDSMEVIFYVPDL